MIVNDGCWSDGGHGRLDSGVMISDGSNGYDVL